MDKKQGTGSLTIQLVFCLTKQNEDKSDTNKNSQ
jgi:hypothetical protein